MLMLVSCIPRSSADASCNLDAKDLPKLLKATSPLIEKGFGDAEVQLVERIAESTPVRDTRTKSFPITYLGKSATLRIEVKKDDVDALEIWFLTEPALTMEIRTKMQQLLK